jgi:hypothetical protein
VIDDWLRLNPGAAVASKENRIMSKKNKVRNRQHEDVKPRPPQRTAAVGDVSPRPRRLTPIKIGIALGVVALGAAVLLRPVLSGGGGNVLTQGGSDVVSLGAAAGTTTTAAASTAVPPKPVATGLPPPAPGTKSPLNDTDPVTDKPITPSSPTLDYKGYAIGFCCASSEGYKGAWNRMSEKEKDAFVRKYLK